MSFIENQDDAVVDLEADVQQATINVRTNYRCRYFLKVQIKKGKVADRGVKSTT